MSEVGQKAKLLPVHATSGQPPSTDIACHAPRVKGHKWKSLGLFDHLSGAVAGALLICPNDVGTGSNRDVPSQVTVEALGYFEKTQIFNVETLAAKQFEQLGRIEKT
jgi:hypothetical protein